MLGITQATPGGAETLRWGEVERPQPSEGEVLIRVHASAFNPADVGMRNGNYLEPEQKPIILGLECAGVIEEVGPGVTRWRVGDRVMALLNSGGYAEYATVPDGMVMSLPSHLTFAQGAALPEALCTVWSNRLLSKQPRASLQTLIHGGAGGVGGIAIQVAKFLGDTVFTTAGSPENLELTRSFGADVPISYVDQDFLAEVLQHTHGVGVDLILDTQGASYFDRNVAALKPDGHLALIGVQGGAEVSVNLLQLMRKRLTLSATMLKNRPNFGQNSKSEIVRLVREDLWPGIVSGEILPHLGGIRPLSEAAAVHVEFAAGLLPAGKTVFSVLPENSR